MSDVINFNRVLAGEILYEGTSFQSYGYGIISQLVTKDRDVSIQAKGLYGYLVSCAGNDRQTYPSQKTMCNDLGIKKEVTLRKYIKELQSKGYIKVLKTKSENLHYNNVYLIATDTRTQLIWMQEYKNKHTKNKSKIIDKTKKSLTCSEVKDSEEINEINKNLIDNSSITDDSINCKEENEKLTQDLNYNDSVDGYVNYHELAYARCLAEVPEFELMTSLQQDFQIALMLRKISTGDDTP